MRLTWRLWKCLQDTCLGPSAGEATGYFHLSYQEFEECLPLSQTGVCHTGKFLSSRGPLFFFLALTSVTL